MKALKEIVGIIEDELDSIAQNGKFRSREEIASVGQMVKAVKDAYCVFDMEDGDEYGRYERSYERSYRAGGQRRDSRGRYKEGEFERKLRDMMNEAPDEQTRYGIRRMLDNINT